MSELQHIVERLRRYDHIDENVQQNINNAIAYLDLAIAAEHRVHLTGGESAEQVRTENELSEWGNSSRPPTSK